MSPLTVAGLLLAVAAACSSDSKSDDDDDDDGTLVCPGGYDTEVDGCSFFWECDGGTTYRMECTDADAEGDYACTCYENNVQVADFVGQDPTNSGNDACGYPDPHALELLEMVETGCGWTGL